jgi:hypothetical protein
VSVAARNAVVLAGCLVVLGVAGTLATTALSTATVAPVQTATASLVVDANEPAGAARLTVLAPVVFRSGGGTREVPAGTQFLTTNDLLTGALPPHGRAVEGDTLRCTVLVGTVDGRPVIDLVHCAPAKTSPRG